MLWMNADNGCPPIYFFLGRKMQNKMPTLKGIWTIFLSLFVILVRILLPKNILLDWNIVQCKRSAYVCLFFSHSFISKLHSNFCQLTKEIISIECDFVLFVKSQKFCRINFNSNQFSESKNGFFILWNLKRNTDIIVNWT